MGYIVKMKLLLPVGGGAQERAMAAVERDGQVLCFWSMIEPEIVRQFEGRDEAWFEASGECPDIRILRSVDEPA